MRINEIASFYKPFVDNVGIDTSSLSNSWGDNTARVLASQAEAIVRTGKKKPQATKWRN